MRKLISLFILFQVFWFSYAQDTNNLNGFKVFYYPNGIKSSEGLLVDGKPEGWWKSYSEKGVLISEGNRKNFLLDSLWVFYNEKGIKTLEINYQEGKKTGQRIQYSENEYIVENWKNDTLYGMVNTYFSDGKMKKSTPYIEGKPHGLEKEYSYDGVVISVTNFYRGVMTRKEYINRTDNFGFKQGNWKYFWDNGNLKMEGSYQNDKRNGFFKYYDVNGNFISVEKFENDKLIEDAPETKVLEKKIAYYPNGKPSITATYYKNKPEGIRREFDTNGVVVKGYLFDNGILRYEGITDLNGKRQGRWIEYYETGEMRSEGEYLNSSHVGEWKFYFQDKTIEIVGSYNRKGEKIGEWRWYYPDGKPLMIENYEEGKLEGLFVEYDNLGNEISKGEYLNNAEEGEWIYVHGNSTEKGSYFDGMRQGLWKTWFNNGKVASEIEFEQDLPNGKFISYWENGTVKLTGKYVTGLRNGVWYKYDEDGILFLTTVYKDGKEIQWNAYKIDNK